MRRTLPSSSTTRMRGAAAPGRRDGLEIGIMRTGIGAGMASRTSPDGAWRRAARPAPAASSALRTQRSCLSSFGRDRISSRLPLIAVRRLARSCRKSGAAEPAEPDGAPATEREGSACATCRYREPRRRLRRKGVLYLTGGHVDAAGPRAVDERSITAARHCRAGSGPGASSDSMMLWRPDRMSTSATMPGTTGRSGPKSVAWASSLTRK